MDGGSFVTVNPMPEPEHTRTSALISLAARGDAKAQATLAPLAYDRLRELAMRYLGRERRDHTLQPTALVHEAYLRLVDQSMVDLNDRNYFISLCAREMRRVLVDHARSKSRAKRGGNWNRVLLDGVPISAESGTVDALDMDAALTELADLDKRHARIVELRFYAGRTVAEAAEILGISPKTVEKDWQMARAWLYRRLKSSSED